jgi:hypothetical protein
MVRDQDKPGYLKHDKEAYVKLLKQEAKNVKNYAADNRFKKKVYLSSQSV